MQLLLGSFVKTTDLRNIWAEFNSHVIGSSQTCQSEKYFTFVYVFIMVTCPVAPRHISIFIFYHSQNGKTILNKFVVPSDCYICIDIMSNSKTWEVCGVFQTHTQMDFSTDNTQFTFCGTPQSPNNSGVQIEHNFKLNSSSVDARCDNVSLAASSTTHTAGMHVHNDVMDKTISHVLVSEFWIG